VSARRTWPWLGALLPAMLVSSATLAAAQTAPASGTAPAVASGAVPRTADGTPDLSGVWQALSGPEFDIEAHGPRPDAPPGLGIVEGGSIPYTAAGQAQQRKNFAARATADPRHKCFTLGVLRGTYSGEPFQIFQRPRDLTVLYQFGHPVRTIHTNGTRHPDGHIDFWLGDSRASWDGDTLVVDVNDFNGETWLDRAGNHASDALHVVERWRLLDANTLEYRATLDDAAVYTKPWSLSVLLHRRREPNAQLLENYCYTLDYDQYYPVPLSTRRTP
jgi:hypothetical protein